MTNFCLGLAHFERLKLQQAETEEKYLQKTASEEELKQKLSTLQAELEEATEKARQLKEQGQ